MLSHNFWFNQGKNHYFWSIYFITSISFISTALVGSGEKIFLSINNKRVTFRNSKSEREISCCSVKEIDYLPAPTKTGKLPLHMLGIIPALKQLILLLQRFLKVSLLSVLNCVRNQKLQPWDHTDLLRPFRNTKPKSKVKAERNEQII